MFQTFWAHLAAVGGDFVALFVPHAELALGPTLLLTVRTQSRLDWKA